MAVSEYFSQGPFSVVTGKYYEVWAIKTLTWLRFYDVWELVVRGYTKSADEVIEQALTNAQKDQLRINRKKRMREHSLSSKMA